MTQAVVTGATGFIGRHLVDRLLAGGIEVIAGSQRAYTPPRKGVFYFEYDLLENAKHYDKLLNAIKPGAVFYHLAWYGSSGKLRSDYNIQIANAKAALDMYQTAQCSKAEKFITVGTVGEYLAPLIIEKAIHSENCIYIAAKNLLKQSLNAISASGLTSAHYVTLSNVYGEDDTSGNLINYTVGAIMRGESANYGPCDQIYDFIHVDDAAYALFKMGTVALADYHYNLSSGQPRMLKEYLLTIGKLANKPQFINIGSRQSDGSFYYPEWFDCIKLKTEIGFEASISFEGRIQELLINRGLIL